MQTSPIPCPVAASLLWLATLEGPWQIGLGALLPQMSRALAQRASASLRGA